MSPSLSELNARVIKIEAIINEQISLRLEQVEKTINDTVIPGMNKADLDRTAMKADTAEILAFVSGVKKTGSLAVRYGPKIVTFGAGIFTAIGLGNPNLWAFVTKFFGG